MEFKLHCQIHSPEKQPFLLALSHYNLKGCFFPPLWSHRVFGMIKEGDANSEDVNGEGVFEEGLFSCWRSIPDSFSYKLQYLIYDKRYSEHTKDLNQDVRDCEKCQNTVRRSEQSKYGTSEVEVMNRLGFNFDVAPSLIQISHPLI